MTPDYRALCAELVKDFDDLRESSEGVAGFHRNGDLAPWEELSESGRYPWLSSFDRARALLAEPVAEGLTDEELNDTYWIAWHKHPDRTNSVLHSVGLRAVLDRWGHQPAPPAEGEVPSLKEQALQVLAELQEGFQPDLADLAVLRRALEAIPEPDGGEVQP